MGKWTLHNTNFRKAFSANNVIHSTIRPQICKREKYNSKELHEFPGFSCKYDAIRIRSNGPDIELWKKKRIQNIIVKEVEQEV